jgi:predicted acetyltransferase
MDEVTIRAIAPDELPAFMSTLEFAFHGREHEDDLEQERLIAEPDRYFVALDGDRMVGTAGACTTRFTVPGGGSITAPGVTAVGVLASHRRRGINTRLMAALLDQAAERGEALAYLWASESAIYGRFGYGMASLSADIELAANRSAFVDGVEVPGRVRLLPRDEALPLMRTAYDAAAAERPGMIAVDDQWWQWLFFERKKDRDEPLFFAVHLDGADVPDGYAVYTVKHEWPHGVPTNELEVQNMVCATAGAEAALWRYLCDVDLVATVRARHRPPDDASLWLMREPRRLHFTLGDGLWLRIVDVCSALAARRYSADGRLVLEVRDAFRPATSGPYELTVEGGEGTCRRTDAEPELVCGIGALGAAYLGGSSFRQLRRAQQVDEVEPGALARADAMFAWDPAPWFGFIF